MTGVRPTSSRAVGRTGYQYTSATESQYAVLMNGPPFTLVAGTAAVCVRTVDFVYGLHLLGPF